MNPAWRLVALALVFAAGCASVEETEPAAGDEKAVEKPAAVAIAKPPTTVKPSVPDPTPTIAPPVTRELPRVSEVDTLLAEFARLRKLPPAELGREQEAARNAFNQSRTDSSRVRLAMALALPGSPASDDARALELLDPLVKTPGATLHTLAFLLAAYIQEQRRLGAQVAGLQQNVHGLQQNVQGLQQKLDAITKLERSLTGRGEGAAVRRR